MSNYSRIEQLADVISHELAVQLNRAQDPRFTQVTIAAVQVANDLSCAKVFVTFFEQADAKQTLDALNKASGYFRHQLAQSLNLRKTPALTFYADTLVEQVDKMEKLFDKIHDENKDR